MRARKYNKKIQIWQRSTVPNEYGGNPLIVPELITTTWCSIKTLGTISRSTEFGITETSDLIRVKLRKRNDITYNSLNQFFVYRGRNYIIQGEPINVDFEDREIQITLKREALRSAEEIDPIGGGFPYTFPFILS